MIGGLTGSGDAWDGFAGSALQAFVLALGGLWALLLYRRRRENQATVRVGLAVALTGAGQRRRLLVRFHIMNTSSRLLRRTEATLTLMDAAGAHADGTPVLKPLTVVDPLLSVNGEMTEPDENGEIRFAYEDYPWYRYRGRPHLEPGECVESEVALPVDGDAEAWAVRLIVTGRQGFLGVGGAYDWGIFALVTAEFVQGKGYVPITQHAGDEE